MARPPTAMSCRSRRRGRPGPGRPARADQAPHDPGRPPGADDPARAALAVGEVRRDRDAPAPADLHAGHALVPAADHLALAERELERVAAVPRRVELLAALPRHADVVDLDDVAGGGLVAVADLDVVELELVGRRLVGWDVDLRLLVWGHAPTVASGHRRKSGHVPAAPRRPWHRPWEGAMPPALSPSSVLPRNDDAFASDVTGLTAVTTQPPASTASHPAARSSLRTTSRWSPWSSITPSLAEPPTPQRFFSRPASARSSASSSGRS